MKKAEFLKKYDTIIFDMDGVITSEQNYWKCAALTVWEWLYSDAYYGQNTLDAAQMHADAANIRAKVFCEDKLITIFKEKGVNSNWDLGYVVFALCVINETDNFADIISFCHSMNDNILDEYDEIASKLREKLGCDCERNSQLWNSMMLTFQEWFLGDELFYKTYKKKPRLCGKPGLIHTEKPIISSDRLMQIFECLSKDNKRLATATGRPGSELFIPLESFGILNYFAKDGIICYDHIMNAENSLKMNLTKPHPYIFCKAMLGEAYDDEKIVKGEFDKTLIEKTLIVGDAGADIIAAKAIGADFCAVLTGVSGEEAREYFEEMQADYILSSLSEFID